MIILPSFLVLNSDAESHNDNMVSLIGEFTVSNLPENQISNQTL